MKLVATLIATLFATVAFAQAPAKKEEAKPAAAPAATKAADAKSAPAPARKTTKKQNLLRSNLAVPVTLFVNDEELEWEADDFIYVGYRRPELIDCNDDLSDYIKWKLFLARQKALLKYKEVWG